MKKLAAILALAMISAPSVSAQQTVAKASDANAEFEEAIRSGPKPTTAEDLKMCVGYWRGLGELHAQMQGQVAFFNNLQSDLSEAAANKNEEGMLMLVAAVTEEKDYKAADERIFAYRTQMIQRFSDGYGAGRIQGVFNTLGSCSPRKE